MNEYENEFEDPGLKAALRRTASREAAPPALRAKVQSLMASEATAAAAAAAATAVSSADAGDANGHATPTAPARSRRRLAIDRAFWRTAAAAACVLLALGFMAYQIRDQFFSSPFAKAPGSGVTTVPESLVLDLTRTHDDCAKLPDHHKIPGDNPEALREKLAAGSGIAATAINLGGDWNFKGAGICKVGDRPAAHLLFVRADDYVSIFSMPAPDDCGYGVDAYSEVYQKHPVAGFRHGDALYCVVGSNLTREMKKDELDWALKKVQGAVATGCLTHDTMFAAAAAGAGHQNR